VNLLPLEFIVLALATFRLTRLVTTDAITERARDWVAAKGPMRAYLVHCDWCISIYAGSLVLGLYMISPVAILVLALSAVTGIIAARVD